MLKTYNMLTTGIGPTNSNTLVLLDQKPALCYNNNMKLSKHSEHRLRKSLNYWRVTKDFADPMYNYLVFGFEPGGFFSGWYANDATAIIRSHPGNSVEALKDLTKWMLNCMPRQAWGSHERVREWIKMDSIKRRAILEDADLIYSEEQETWMILKDEPLEKIISYY